MKLLLRTLLAAALLVLVAIAATALVLQFAPSRTVPAFEAGLSQYLGRPLSIGDIQQVRLGADIEITASGLQLANAPWAGTVPLASVERLTFGFSLPSIWRDGPFVIRTLHIADARLDLQRNGAGAENWMLPVFEGEADDDEAGLLIPVVLEHADNRNTTLRYRDEDQDVQANLSRLRLRVRESDHFSVLEAEGEVNDLPFTANGTLGPAPALLSGRGIQLQTVLELGSLRVDASGEVDDLESLTGVDLDLLVEAPQSRQVLDILGLQEVRDGPLSFRGHVADANPGMSIDARGQLAEFSLQLAGQIRQPAQGDGVDLELALRGPSIAETGAILGLQGLRDIPYEFFGRLQREGRRLAVRDARLSGGEGELRLDGELPNYPGIDDWRASIAGRGVNLAILGGVAGVTELPGILLDIDGELSSSPEGVELIDLRLVGNQLNVAMQGTVGDMPGFTGTDLQLTLAGEDMSLLQPLLGLASMPAEPYRLEGRLRQAGEAWRVSDAALQSGQFTLSLDAQVDRLIDAREGAGSFRFGTPDLPAALAAYGVTLEGIKPVPLRLRGQVQLATGGFEISDLRGAMAELEFQGSGLLSNRSDLSGSELRLRASGDNLARIVSSASELQAPEAPFELDLDARWLPPLADIDRLDLKLGGNQLRARLTADPANLEGGAEGSIAMSGDSVENLLALFDIDSPLKDSAYDLRGELHADPEQIRLKGLALQAGPSDLDGNLRLRFGEIPRLDAELHSRVLAVELAQPIEQREERADPQDGTGGSSTLFVPPTREQLKARTIPDSPLPLDWIRSVEGSWSYSVDRALAREEVESNIHLALDIEDAVLISRRLEWDGSVSRGQASLSIDARDDTYRIKASVDTSRLPMVWLLQGNARPTQTAVYRAQMRTQGQTWREAAANLNGIVATRGADARVSNRNLDLLLGDIPSSVLTRLNPNREQQQFTRVECHAGAATVTDGLIQLDPGIALRTGDVDIMISGALHLKDETLGVSFNTRPRKGLGLSASKAVTPYLLLSGNLAHPFLTLDPQGTVIYGGAAIATGGLSLVADTLWSRWKASREDPCEQIALRAQQDPRGVYKALFPDSLQRE